MRDEEHILRDMATGHFDRKKFQTVSVVSPGEFLRVPDVGRLIKRLTGD